MYNFDYFYGDGAKKYQFYMIPQLLFTDDKFKQLSSDAKILYSLLLDRAGLSNKNKDKFQDENGRTFVFFSQDTAMGMLNCAKEKITKVFKELDNIGLIYRKRQGLGKPTKIYVKDFSSLVSENNDNEKDVTIELQEVRKSNFRGSEIELQKIRKSNTNHTNINQTNNNHIYINQSIATNDNLNVNENIKKEMTDRLTDKNKKNKSFEDVLTEIGFPNRLSKESFQYGFVSQDIENLKKCSIPISYHSDKKAMRESLEFFAQYNYACNGFTEQSDLTLYKQVIDILCNFSEKEKTYLNGGFISYRQIIDALNDKIHEHGDLYEWVVMVMDEWKSLNASKKVTPRNPVAYLRTCIWNWLKGNELELKESAYGYSAAVTITARNSQNNGEPKVLAAPGSTFGEYWSDMKKTTAQRQNNQNNGEPKIIAAPGSTVGECWNAMNKTPKKAEKTTLPFGFTMDEYMAYLQRKSEDMQRKRA